MRHLVAIISVLAVLGAGVVAQQSKSDSQSTQTCTLKVTGMFCSACAKTVEKAAKKIDGVTIAKADQLKGIAEVTYDPGKTSPAAIAKAIARKSPFKVELEAKK